MCTVGKSWRKPQESGVSHDSENELSMCSYFCFAPTVHFVVFCCALYCAEALT